MSRQIRQRLDAQEPTPQPGTVEPDAEQTLFSSRPLTERESCEDDRRPDPHPGALLRRSRMAAGLRLEDLTRRTKIPKSVLLALESADLDHLPAAVYTRGFVKSYASEVGLDPERTAADYLSAVEPFAEPATAEPMTLDGVEAEDDTRQVLAANQMRRFSRVVLAGAAIGLLFYFTPWGRGNRPAPPPLNPLVDQSSPRAALKGVPVDGDVVPALANVEGDAVAPTLAPPLRVDLATTGECWVAAQVDGERVLYRLLEKGERITFEVRDEALLRVGEPGALSVSIDGRPLNAVGPPGQPVDLRISRDNYQDLITS